MNLCQETGTTVDLWGPTVVSVTRHHARPPSAVQGGTRELDDICHHPHDVQCAGPARSSHPMSVVSQSNNVYRLDTLPILPLDVA